MPSIPLQSITGASGKSAPRHSYGHNLPNTIRSRSQLRLLSLVSAGPIEGLSAGQSSLRLDGVPVVSPQDNSVNISGVSWQLLNGDDAQSTLPDGFNAIEQTQPVHQDLRHNTPYTRSGQGEAARLILQCPEGLIKQTQDGIFGASVTFKIETRHPDGRWREAARRTIAEKQTGFFEISLRVEFSGNYTKTSPAIRITRLTPEPETTAIRNRLVWGAITWIKRDRLSYQGLSTLAMTLDAEAFSGRLPQIECDIKGRLLRLPKNYDPIRRHYDGIWDGSFQIAYSNNPAWVVFDLLTDRQWGLGLKDTLVEVYDLYAIARYADETVPDGTGGDEPRFTFDAVLHRRQSAYDLLQQICAGMRVMMFWSGGRLRFVQDKPADAVMWLTNHHVEDGAFVYTGASRRHQISHALVSYIDPAAGNGVRVEAETNPEVLARFGYKAQEVALLGCRRRSQARRHARWLMDKADAALHGVSWRAGLDHFAANPIRPGDVVRVFDQLRMTPQDHSGRAMSSGDGVYFDQPLAAGDYYADVETANGWLRNHRVSITATEVDSNWSRVKPAAPWPSEVLDQGAMVIKSSRHDAGLDYRVVAVRELDRHRVEVDAIRHDNRRFQAIEQDLHLPPTPRQDQPDFSQPIAPATALSYQQPPAIDGVQGLRDLLLSWQAPLDQRIAYWRLFAVGPDGAEAARQVSASPAIFSGLAIGEWRITLRAVDWLGREGLPAETKAIISADPHEATAPKKPVLSPGYEQLLLSWEAASLPRDAEVEVLEFTSATAKKPKPNPLVIAAHQSRVILAGREADKAVFFSLRTRLKGGSLSPETKRLSAAPLAWPKPSDGRDGQDGTVMAAAVITEPVWSDDAARAAIAAIRGEGRAPVAGDLVTLSVSDAEASWAETRRFSPDASDEVWQEAVALSGTALVPETVAASRLKLDDSLLASDPADDRLTITHLPAGLITSGVLQSSSYRAKAEGFRIDTAGQAEFNDAHIRGRLDSSRIESSLLVAPITVLPTEDYDQFFTLDVARPIIPRDTAYQDEWVVLGPLVIRPDRLSRRYQDGGQLVLAANDPHGVADTGTHQGHNIYFSRFWSRRPIIHLDLDYAPFNPAAGAVINNGRLAFKIRTASGKVLASSAVTNLSAKTSWRLGAGNAEQFGFLTGGFGAGSLFHIRREMTGSGNTLTTSRLTLTVDMVADLSHAPPQPEADGLYIDVLLDFSATPLSQSAQHQLKRQLVVDATTFD